MSFEFRKEDLQQVVKAQFAEADKLVDSSNYWNWLQNLHLTLMSFGFAGLSEYMTDETLGPVDGFTSSQVDRLKDSLEMACKTLTLNSCSGEIKKELLNLDLNGIDLLRFVQQKYGTPTLRGQYDLLWDVYGNHEVSSKQRMKRVMDELVSFSRSTLFQTVHYITLFPPDMSLRMIDRCAQHPLATVDSWTVDLVKSLTADITSQYLKSLPETDNIVSESAMITVSKKKKKKKKPGLCYYCNKPGHYIRNCRVKAEREATSKTEYAGFASYVTHDFNVNSENEGGWLRQVDQVGLISHQFHLDPHDFYLDSG